VHKFYLFTLLLFCYSCVNNKKPMPASGLDYAVNFSIDQIDKGTILKVQNPWPKSLLNYRYLLLDEGQETPTDSSRFTQIIRKPIRRIIATATPQITALDLLGAVDKVVAFPTPDFVSNTRFRERLAQNQITSIGNNQQLDVERILRLKPDVFFAFGISDNFNALEQLKKAGIAVVWIADWTENHPLGRTEWLKFFAPFFDKEPVADSIFLAVKKEYNQVKNKLINIPEKPKVMAGAIYQDIWYLPGGNSYLGKLFEDAQANYLWSDTNASGSLSKNAEHVILKAQNAEFWFAPAQYTSYRQLEEEGNLYKRFKPYKTQKIFTYNKTLGPSGGTLFFETGPYQPDRLLKDIVYWMHPGLIENHTPFYFTQLDD